MSARRLTRLILSLLLAASPPWLLTACQPVPLSSNNSRSEPLRPVKPLPWKTAGTVQSNQNPTTPGFKVADTSAPTPKPGGAKPAGKPATPATTPPDNVAIATKLAEAEDKAASALSMQQSAQTQEDWNLVFDRWKLAINMLKAIPGKNPAVQQKIAQFQSGLVTATQQARISLDPSLAPVDSVGANAKGVIGVPGEVKPTPSTKPTNPTAAPAATGKPLPQPESKPSAAP
jgi:hypothetical protein